MTKRKAVWTALSILVAASMMGVILGVNAIHDITLTEAQIQERIDAKLPLVKNEITIQRMRVQFLNGSLVVMPEIEGKKWKQEFLISVKANGVPYYDGPKGVFYFRPQTIEVTNLKIKGEAVSEKTKRFIDRFIDSPNINRNKDVIGAKVEEWVHGSIESMTTGTLKRVPIYTLPDTLKGNLVRILLKSVEINDSTLILHLSVWQFTKIVMLYIAFFLIAIITAVALLMNPEWGITLLLIGGLGDN